MRTCPTCGEENLDRARFCQACAVPLELPARQELRRTVTAVFCDVVGSTAMAEDLADPEPVREILQRFFRVMSSIVDNHGGTTEKFIGDAVKATFGLPRAHEDDPLRAARAALEMRNALDHLNVELMDRWGVQIRTRTGINTGDVIAGPAMGGQELALGDAMNTAARLQQAADPNEILIGEQTYRLLEEHVVAEPTEVIRMKGKRDPQRAFRLIGIKEPAQADTGRGAMLERERELEAMIGAFHQVLTQGRAALIVLLGDPGIGKTTLLQAATPSFTERARVVSNNCSSYGEKTTLTTLAQIAVDLLQLGGPESDIEKELTEKLEDLIREPGERLAVRSALRSLLGRESSGTAETDVFSVWREIIRASAQLDPLVIILEDVHWADDVLLELVEQVVISVELPLLVICTSRPDLYDRRPDWREKALTLRLPPLSDDAIGTLLDRSSVHPDQLERSHLLKRAEGNPLFAKELGRSLAARSDSNDHGGSVRLPTSLKALIASRLDTFPESEAALVRDAAVIGEPFTATAIATFGENPVTRVRSALEALVTRELVRRESSSSGPEPLFYFSHQLVREVAYDQLPKKNLAQKHRRAAELLGSSGGLSIRHLDALAHHWVSGLTSAQGARLAVDEIEPFEDGACRSLTELAARSVAVGDAATSVRAMGKVVEVLRGRGGRVELDIAAAAGRTLVDLGRWGEVIELLEPLTGPGDHRILRSLGLALCKLHMQDRSSSDYKRGQELLARAATASQDVDAIASLAGSWKGLDEDKARALYRQASQADPTDPYPLGNLLESEILSSGDLSVVDAYRPQIERALARCRAELKEERNLPWAVYDIAKLSLLTGHAFASFYSYAQAVDLSASQFVVETSLGSLKRLEGVSDLIPGHPWVVELLELALRGKYEVGYGRTEGDALGPPILVLAGSTAIEHAEEISALGPLLLEALADFQGTIISGGTKRGVAGIAGSLRRGTDDRVTVLGYVPSSPMLQEELDPNYSEVRTTPGDDFSPLEPLSYWGDILNSSIPPGDVRLIGAGGGRITRAEFTLALALGARVGIVKGTGRAAGALLSDAHWSRSERLDALDPEPEAIRMFIQHSPASTRQPP